MRQPVNRNFVSRRQFLKYGILGIAGLISGAIAAPLIRYFVSPALKSEKASWVAIARTKDVPVGKPTYVEYEQRIEDSWRVITRRKAAWVVTQDGQNFTVFDPHCTHLGCPYTWVEEGWKGKGPYKGQPHFHCPCHEGIFAIDGTVISGPPPRPLDRLQSKVDGGTILARET